MTDYFNSELDDLNRRGYLSEPLLKSISKQWSTGVPSFKLKRVERLLNADPQLMTHEDFAELLFWYLHHAKADMLQRILVPGTIKGAKPRAQSSYQLVRQGWTAEDFVSASILLSERNIVDYESVESDFNYWVGLRRKSLPFFMALTYCGEMIGQVAMTLVTESEFRRLEAGEQDERKLSGGQYSGAGQYFGYISTITVDKPFRSTGAVSTLLRAAIAGMQDMERKGINLVGIAANAYSDEGATLCERAGLRYLRDDKEHGRIYSGTFADVIHSDLTRVLNQKRP